MVIFNSYVKLPEGNLCAFYSSKHLLWKKISMLIRLDVHGCVKTQEQPAKR